MSAGEIDDGALLDDVVDRPVAFPDADGGLEVQATNDSPTSPTMIIPVPFPPYTIPPGIYTPSDLHKVFSIYCVTHHVYRATPRRLQCPDEGTPVSEQGRSTKVHPNELTQTCANPLTSNFGIPDRPAHWTEGGRRATRGHFHETPTATEAVIALGIVGYGLLGFVTGGLLRVAVGRSSFVPPCTRPLAPPMLLELLTAALCSTLAWHVGAKPELLAYSWFAAVGVQLAAIDRRTRRLPTKLIWPSGVGLAALFVFAAAVGDTWGLLLRSAAGMFALLAFYGVLYVFRPGELGGGDLRLGAMSGLALGWAGWSSVAAGVLLCWLAAAAALVALRIRRQEAPRDLPLGPFIVIGCVAGVLVSPVG